MEAPADILTAFSCTNAAHIAASPIADVWKVEHAGQFAALKVYKGRNPINEAVGFDFLRSCNGAGCTFIHHYQDGVAIMEWLDGPSLGDLSRGGLDMQACQLLINTAEKLHSTQQFPNLPLPKVQSFLTNFIGMGFQADCPKSTQAAFTTCKDIAANLIATQINLRPLHGDFHHDNIRQSARGPLCFDAKGVFGESTYEVAAALVNPIDRQDIVQNPVRAVALAAAWAKICGVSRKRVLQWAAVKAAMMVRCTQNGELDHNYESSAVHFFLGLLDADASLG